MKKITIATAVCLSITMMTACNNQQSEEKQQLSLTNTQHLVSKDSANKMISSYLASLDSVSLKDSTALYSLIFNAAALRTYLANPSIDKVKIMFAHSLDYINQGNNGIPAGYTSGALTIVIAGANEDGDYVFDNGRVMNAAMPCPRACLIEGTASHNLLQ